MNIEHGSGPNRCTCCMRKKEEALREHLQSMENCDNPNCPFYDIINAAIEEARNKPKMTFGQPQKPKFSFGTKTKN